jgi:hypothetical protein
MGLRTLAYFPSNFLHTMKIEIKGKTHSGKEIFEFVLLDGEDEGEKVRGYSSDLISVFTKIIEWRERISREYS